MNLENITVIGTSHISKDSVKNVKKTILDKHPDFVAIELDRNRLLALSQKKNKGPGVKDIRRLGVKGWLFALLGNWVERSLGKRVGVSPGTEMLSAVHAASLVNAKVALIDQDISITLKRFSKYLTWREKWNFVVDFFKGLFGFNVVKFDISKVPEDQMIDTLINDVKKRYPNVYRVLIEERNTFMAKQLVKLLEKYPDSVIVAVVGAGHKKDMVSLLKKYLK